MARIYISSTFSDLREHRVRVEQSLERLGHQVTAMEHYVATDRRPVDKCLADVEACDLYVGLFAWRYGYVPPQDNPESRSITELEYRHAKGRLPCLLFLHDETAGWPPAKIDEGEARQRIKSLRAEMMESTTVSFFQDPASLEALVTAAVANWEKERRTAPAAVAALHVLAAKHRPPHWSDAAEIRFSISNLSAATLKLARLLLVVRDRTELDDVEFKKAGAPVREFTLEARIGDGDEVDLLADVDTQFILPAGTSDAFKLALTGPEGFAIDAVLRALLHDLATGTETRIESPGFEIAYPIRSLDVLERREKRS